MNRAKQWRKIQEAIETGLERKEGVRAEPGQPLTFILSDKKFYHHATLESAKAEKEFLQAALSKEMRIYKVWNTKREMVESDMKLLRNTLSNLPNWDDTQKAMDRILSGAGY